jgi:hypothetical protein
MLAVSGFGHTTDRIRKKVVCGTVQRCVKYGKVVWICH